MADGLVASNRIGIGSHRQLVCVNDEITFESRAKVYGVALTDRLRMGAPGESGV